MTKAIELHIESFIHIPQTASVAEALNALETSQATYAVVGDGKETQALLSRLHLEKLEKTRILTDLSKLSLLLVVDDNQWTIKRVKKISQLLKKNKNCYGVVIYQQSEVRGVISRGSVAKALPIDSSEKMYGDSQVPVRTYICRQCAPPTYALPRHGGAPICPKNLLHGQMQEEP